LFGRLVGITPKVNNGRIDIQNAPVKHQDQAEREKVYQKACDDYYSGRSKAEAAKNVGGFDPDKFLCERGSNDSQLRGFLKSGGHSDAELDEIEAGGGSPKPHKGILHIGRTTYGPWSDLCLVSGVFSQCSSGSFAEPSSRLSLSCSAQARPHSQRGARPPHIP
jgi:hypothetical protein